MAFSGPALTRNVKVTIGDIPCTVNIAVATNYAVTFDLLYHGTPYTFEVAKWGGKGQSLFLRRFYSIAREPTLFGEIEENVDGELTKTPTIDQRREAVVQATVELLNVVDRILKEDGRSALDYAAWYLENKLDESDYPHYVAKIAATFIVQSNFLDATVDWKEIL